MYCDKIYIIGPAGDQYEDNESVNGDADVGFIKDINDHLLSFLNIYRSLWHLMMYDLRKQLLINMSVKMEIIFVI